jgi:excisionase family DNA binding protein
MAKARPTERARFSTGELARLVQASRSSIVRYIEEGRIRARRSAGGWYVISREEVIQFLWDLSFSKSTPLRMWRAATLAYEQMSQVPKAEPTPPQRSRRKRT